MSKTCCDSNREEQRNHFALSLVQTFSNPITQDQKNKRLNSVLRVCFSLKIFLIKKEEEEVMMFDVLSEVCMIRVLLYWPTPLALKAFTLDLYVLLKWSPSTVQMVSDPTYTSC